MKLTKNTFIENYLVKKNSTIKIKETITIKDVEKWNKDFQAFTKDLRRIKTEEDRDLVMKYLRPFGINFEEFFYANIAGFRGSQYTVSSKNYENERLSSAIEDAKSSVWTLRVYLTNSLPDELSRIEYENGIAKEYVHLYRNETKTYDKFIDSLYQKLGRLGREAFEAIYKIFEVEEELLDFYKQEYIKIDGINTILVYAESDSDRIRNEVKQTEINIKDIKKLALKKGFTDLFNNLTLILDRQQSGKTKTSNTTTYTSGTAGAFFDPKDMSISLYQYDLETFIHELGHKYYSYNLKKEQQEFWKSFIDGSAISIHIRDVPVLASKIEQTLSSFIYEMLDTTNPKYEGWSSSNKIPEIVKYLNNKSNLRNFTESELIILDTVNNKKLPWQYFFPLMGEYTINREWIINRITREIETTGYYGRGVLHEMLRISPRNMYITEYGNANELEAYAETFRLYLLDRPIPELILEQFYNTKGN